MITWFRAGLAGLSTLQTYLLIAGLSGLVSLGGGFYAGQRWQKGAELAAVERALEAERKSGAAALAQLQDEWEAKWSEAQAQLAAWQLQAQKDQQIAKVLAAQLHNMSVKYNDIRARYENVKSFGECRFTSDALSLLDDANSNRDPRTSGEGS